MIASGSVVAAAVKAFVRDESEYVFSILLDVGGRTLGWSADGCVVPVALGVRESRLIVDAAVIDWSNNPIIKTELMYKTTIEQRFADRETIERTFV